jgi:hypothetical protein
MMMKSGRDMRYAGRVRAVGGGVRWGRGRFSQKRFSDWKAEVENLETPITFYSPNIYIKQVYI